MTKMMEEIMELSREERIKLADVIWQSTYDDDPPYSIEEDSESIWLQSKLAEQAKTPDNVMPWEEMKARIQTRFF